MVKSVLAALTVLVLGLGVLWAGEPAPAAKPDPAVVTRLITQLGSDRFEERQAASASLDALGPAALDALRAAQARGDLETRCRAANLVERIEKRLESAELLRPKTVRLLYANTPLTQAVDDMARKTGFPIQFVGDKNKLAKRRITLDTGEVPFWQAADLFCQRAGLVERGSVAVADDAGPQAGGMPDGFGGLIISDWVGYSYARPEMPLVLVEGKPLPAPTCHAGAVRIRVLPRSTLKNAGQQSGAPVNKPDGETLLTVEISPEPKLGMQRVLSVQVDKVLDDKGNELPLPMPYIGNLVDSNAMLGIGAGMVRNIDWGNPDQNLSKRVPIRFHAPKGVSKLKELRGRVSMEVLTPLQPVVTVEDVLNAAGKTVNGKTGETVTVAEIDRNKEGEITIRLTVQRSAADEAAAMAGPLFLANVKEVSFEDTSGDASVAAKIFSLVDESSKAFKLTAAQPRPTEGGEMEYTLTFRPPTAGAKPSKLIYLAQRPTIIDVPFTLKDVPFP
jgi:hypothetical protein